MKRRGWQCTRARGRHHGADAPGVGRPRPTGGRGAGRGRDGPVRAGRRGGGRRSRWCGVGRSAMSNRVVKTQYNCTHEHGSNYMNMRFNNTKLKPPPPHLTSRSQPTLINTTRYRPASAHAPPPANTAHTAHLAQPTTSAPRWTILRLRVYGGDSYHPPVGQGAVASAGPLRRRRAAGRARARSWRHRATHRARSQLEVWRNRDRARPMISTESHLTNSEHFPTRRVPRRSVGPGLPRPGATTRPTSEPGRSVGPPRPYILPTARLLAGRSVGAHRVGTGLARVAGSIGRGR
jgi:hypothetical protein